MLKTHAINADLCLRHLSLAISF